MWQRATSAKVAVSGAERTTVLSAESARQATCATRTLTAAKVSNGYERK